MKVTILVDTYGIKKTIAHSYNTLLSVGIRLNLFEYTFNNVLFISTAAAFEFLPEGCDFTTIWLADTKPYWRLRELTKHSIHYKGNRKLYLPNVREAQNSFLGALKTLGIKLFKYTDVKTSLGFEADDLAAAWLKMKHRKDNVTILLTNDTDWLPLCKRAGVLWCNIFNSEPRVRTRVNILDWVRNASMFQLPKSKPQFEFNYLSDIWKFKAMYGDKSDNIPPFGENWAEILPYIDLFNPAEGWDLLDYDDFWLQLNNYPLSPKQKISYSDFRDKATTGLIFEPFVR